LTYLQELLGNRTIRGLLGLVLAVAVVAGAARFWNYGTWNAGVDFYQFWLVGQAAGEPETDDIYSRPDQIRIAAESLAAAHADPDAPRLFIAAEAREEIEVFSTPLLYTVFGVAATGRYQTDYQRYRTLVLLLTIGGLAILGRVIGFSWLRMMGFGAVFLLGFEPLYTDLRVLNVNQLQLAMVVLYFAIRVWGDPPFDDLLGGLVLALACLFKPNLAPAVALLGAYWLIDRRWRTLSGHAIGGVVGLGLGLAASWWHFGGPAPWMRWMEALRGLPEAWIPVNIGNFSFSAVILERTGQGVSALLLAGFMAVAVAVLAWRTKRIPSDGTFAGLPSPSAERDLRVLSIGILVYLLGAGLVWQHYYLLTVPAFYLAARPAAGKFLPWWRWLLLGIAFLPHVADERLRHFIASGPEVFTLELTASTLILFGLLLGDPVLGRRLLGRRGIEAEGRKP